MLSLAASTACGSLIVPASTSTPVKPNMPVVSGGEPQLAGSSSLSALSGRRRVLASFAAGAGMLMAMPAPSQASYALYSASQSTMAERKATGDWQKSIGSDTTALQEIQAGIAKKRPQSELKAKRAPQYCAGQTAAVSPMMENRCGIIGVSKADQSNAMTDSCAHPSQAIPLRSVGPRPPTYRAPPPTDHHHHHRPPPGPGPVRYPGTGGTVGTVPGIGIGPGTSHRCHRAFRSFALCTSLLASRCVPACIKSYPER